MVVFAGVNIIAPGESLYQFWTPLDSCFGLLLKKKATIKNNRVARRAMRATDSLTNIYR